MLYCMCLIDTAAEQHGVLVHTSPDCELVNRADCHERYNTHEAKVLRSCAGAHPRWLRGLDSWRTRRRVKVEQPTAT